MTIALVFLLILVVFALFLSEVLPPDLVALGVLVTVMLLGWITPAEGFSSFANEAPITVAAMFILSFGLQRSGAIEDVGRWMRRFPRLTELKLLLLLMLCVTVVSAFVNNTPVVVAFMPLVLGLARHYEIQASKLLIPLSYAAIFGGTCTLIGTSTNLAVGALARSKYGIQFTIFEITGIGIITAAIGITYMATIGRRLLPGRDSLASLVSSTSMREYVTEVLVTGKSPLAGQRLGDTELQKIASLRVQRIVRGEEELPAPLREAILQPDDLLVIGCTVNALMELHALTGLAQTHDPGLGLEAVRTGETLVVEAVVTNQSHFVDRTVKKCQLRETFGAMVLAVHRHGENITRNVNELPLRFGDTLLLRLPQQGMAQIRGSNDLLLLSDTAFPEPRRSRQPIVLAVLAAVVGLATFNVYPISVLTLAGVVILVLTRCLRMREVYDAVDWRIVSMIVGMIALGTAMEKTGAASWLAGLIVDHAGSLPPVLVLLGFYAACMALTEMISNNAVAVLMTPIAVQTATSLHLNPVTFLVAIMFAASASFATPIGYQTNTFIYGAGGYRFTDFVKVGLPLNLLFLIAASILIPLFFPLR